MKIIFVTGTGTDVGKTYCACALIDTIRHREVGGQASNGQASNGQPAKVRVGVYKPVASGCDENLVAEDAVKLWQAAGQPLDLDAVCPQRFRPPLAPPEAARLTGTEVDEALLFRGLDVWVDGNFDVIVVEGAGGLFSPLSEQMLNLHYLERLQSRYDAVETVLIAADRLGVVHDVLACTRAAQAAGTPVDRIVLNRWVGETDPSVARNLAMLRTWTDIPIEVQIPPK